MSAEGRDHDIAAALDNLAIVHKRLGHYDEALRLSSESLARQRRIGDLAGVALCLNSLAGTCLILHDYAAARAHLQEALATTQREGQVFARTYVLGTLAELALKTGDWTLAAEQGTQASELAQRSGNRGVYWWMKLLLARAAVRRHELAPGPGQLGLRRQLRFSRRVRPVRGQRLGAERPVIRSRCPHRIVRTAGRDG